MRGGSGSGDDKPPSKDSGEIPFMVKWNLTKASPTYVLYEFMVKWYNHNNNYLSERIENREVVKGLLTIFSTTYGRVIATHLWVHGAITTEELITAFKISKQTINHILSKFERLGFVRRACEVDRPKGKSGQVSWIYALTVADTQAIADAQLRYNDIIKRKQREKRELRKERRRLAAEEMRRKAEARAHLKGTLLQTLVTEFGMLYEKTKQPVSLQEIDKKVKSLGLSNSNAFLEVALKLEEKGILTWSYLNGKPDPNWKPPSQIRRVREAREGKL